MTPGNLDSSLCFIQSSISHDVQGLRAGGDGETKDEMVDGNTHSMDMSLSKLQEIAEDRGA